jgi:hypothetical protein
MWLNLITIRLMHSWLVVIAQHAKRDICKLVGLNRLKHGKFSSCLSHMVATLCPSFA